MHTILTQYICSDIRTLMPHIRMKCLASCIIYVVISIWTFSAIATIPLTQAQSYFLVKVVDGDTIVATDGNIRFKLRIAGMDAPEHDQAYGKAAKTILEKLLSNKPLQIKPVGGGIDIYGRSLGQVSIGGIDVSIVMIKMGYATYYRPKCQDYPTNADLYNYDPRAYVEAEAVAKNKKLNIWSSKYTELPCQYRKNNPHK